MTHIVSESESEIDRPAESWTYPYVAAVVDFGSNFSISVLKADDRAVGYAVTFSLHISSTDKTAIGFLDEFCERHDIHAALRSQGEEGSERYRLEINRRDDMVRFLKVVRPYLISKEESARLVIDELVPKLERREHSTKEGFVRVVETIDKLRAESRSLKGATYTAEYFRDEWDV